MGIAARHLAGRRFPRDPTPYQVPAGCINPTFPIPVLIDIGRVVGHISAGKRWTAQAAEKSADNTMRARRSPLLGMTLVKRSDKVDAESWLSKRVSCAKSGVSHIRGNRVKISVFQKFHFHNHDRFNDREFQRENWTRWHVPALITKNN